MALLRSFLLGGHFPQVCFRRFFLKKNDLGTYHSNMGFHTMWEQKPRAPKKKSKPKKTVSKCSRCGRSGHSKDKCYAKSHVNGYQLHRWAGK